MERMRISQLAERSGVPATTLRFYEAAGLVPAERSAAGYRLYSQEALERLGFISVAKHLGLSLDEIAELLDVRERGACAQVKAELRPRLAARLVEAEARRAEAGGFIDELLRALAHLDALPERDGRCDPQCGFLSDRSASRAITADLPWPVSGEQHAQRRETPVACSLRPDELQERTARWRAVLADGLRRDIDEGIAVSVPAVRAGELAALCVAEQECCPFFSFVLRVDGLMIHLEVRAPLEAHELVEHLMTA